jgi:hypothetical protein
MPACLPAAVPFAQPRRRDARAAQRRTSGRRYCCRTPHHTGPAGGSVHGSQGAKRVTIVGAGTTGRTRSSSTSRPMRAASVSTPARVMSMTGGSGAGASVRRIWREHGAAGCADAGEWGGEGTVQGIHDGRGRATAASWRGLATLPLPCKMKVLSWRLLDPNKTTQLLLGPR